MVVVEHRLERCLPAADRVLALRDGAVAFDGTPAAFAAWAPPELQPPATRLCALAGIVGPPRHGQGSAPRAGPSNRRFGRKGVNPRMLTGVTPIPTPMSRIAVVPRVPVDPTWS